MSISSEEVVSIQGLVEESEETAEIAQQLRDYLKHDHSSMRRVRALALGFGIDEIDDIPQPTPIKSK